MNFKILALVLVAVLLVFAGCAKKGETAPVGTTTGGTGTTTGGTGTTAGAGANASDVGNLFNVDTDKPEEGSGYNVPAPSG